MAADLLAIKHRSQARRRRMESHRAASFAEAEEWDLRYWQQKTPGERLAALVAIREDVLKVRAARRQTRK